MTSNINDIGDIEDVICTIFSREHPDRKVDTRSDLFGIGLQSIQIVRLVALVSKEFDARISLARFSAEPTIGNLAIEVADAQRQKSVTKHT